MGCEKTSEVFLCECRHLEEFVQILEDDYEYPLTIDGKSLVNILSEYSKLKRKGWFFGNLTIISLSLPIY